MRLPSIVLLDRDGVLNFNSPDPESPFYYITRVEDLVIKPGAVEAIALLRAHSIPLALVTKQRCIGRNLASRGQIDLINRRLERLIGAKFVRIYVEEIAENKANLYREVLADNELHGGKKEGVVLFDDSPTELRIAREMGIAIHDGTDILSAVKALLHIS